MIPQDLVDSINEEVGVYDIIKHFVDLKRTGATYKGLSPYTKEKTPSFMVNPVKNIYKCFSSGQGGSSAIKYLMTAEKLTFVDSIKFICGKMNIEYREEVNKNTYYKSKDEYYNALEFANEFFVGNLLNNKNALNYMIDRGFSQEVLNVFNVGYSLDDWTSLYYASLKEKHSLSTLEETDLIVHNGRKVYDKFRNRIMFPLENNVGKIIGFGARVLKDEEGVPKYVNSSETLVYKKSYILYGLNQAKNSIRKLDFCFITEGYTDVISFYQNGVKNVVAAAGTSLTVKHLQMLQRHTNNIVFVFDGDKAGVKATMRSIDLALELGFNVRVVKLENIDPDDLAKQKKGNLNKFLVSTSVDFIDYKLSFKPKGIEQKSNVINNLFASISRIKDPIQRKLYTDKASLKTNINRKSVNDIVYDKMSTQKSLIANFSFKNNNEIDRLIHLIESNETLVVEGLKISDYIAIKIFELEDPNFDIEKISDLIFSSSGVLNENLNSPEEVVSEIDEIFNSLQKKYIKEKLSNCDEGDMSFVQELLNVKNAIL